jgi:hypothetical protein
VLIVLVFVCVCKDFSPLVTYLEDKHLEAPPRITCLQSPPTCLHGKISGVNLLRLLVSQ